MRRQIEPVLMVLYLEWEVFAPILRLPQPQNFHLHQIQSCPSHHGLHAHGQICQGGIWMAGQERYSWVSSSYWWHPSPKSVPSGRGVHIDVLFNTGERTAPCGTTHTKGCLLEIFSPSAIRFSYGGQDLFHILYEIYKGPDLFHVFLSSWWMWTFIEILFLQFLLFISFIFHFGSDGTEKDSNVVIYLFIYSLFECFCAVLQSILSAF